MTVILTASGVAFAEGAIAVDDDQGTKSAEVGYGVGEGATRAEAEADALATCKKSGNSGCEVVVHYSHCGAYASSKKYSGIGWGDSEAIAKSKALDKCGDSSCRIVVSDCSK